MPKPKPKKSPYVIDQYVAKLKAHVRVEVEGKGAGRTWRVQVWLDERGPADGDPDGDWVMLWSLSMDEAILRAVRQTRQ